MRISHAGESALFSEGYYGDYKLKMYNLESEMRITYRVTEKPFANPELQNVIWKENVRQTHVDKKIVIVNIGNKEKGIGVIEKVYPEDSSVEYFLAIFSKKNIGLFVNEENASKAIRSKFEEELVKVLFKSLDKFFVEYSIEEKDLRK